MLLTRLIAIRIAKRFGLNDMTVQYLSRDPTCINGQDSGRNPLCHLSHAAVALLLFCFKTVPVPFPRVILLPFQPSSRHQRGYTYQSDHLARGYDQLQDCVQDSIIQVTNQPFGNLHRRSNV